jgi:hypothetical protein
MLRQGMLAAAAAAAVVVVVAAAVAVAVAADFRCLRQQLLRLLQHRLLQQLLRSLFQA